MVCSCTRASPAAKWVGVSDGGAVDATKYMDRSTDLPTGSHALSNQGTLQTDWSSTCIQITIMSWGYLVQSQWVVGGGERLSGYHWRFVLRGFT